MYHMNTRKKIFLFALASFLALQAEGAYAEETTGTSGTVAGATSSLQMKKQEEARRLLERKNTIQNNLQEKRTDIKSNILEKRASSSETRIKVKANIEGKRASSTEKRAELQERRQENVEKIKTQVRERMRKFIGVIIERLEAAVLRMEKLIERISSRIEKLKEKGVDTLKAEEYLEAAKTDVGQARTIIEGIPAALEDALLSEELRGSFEGIRELIQNVKEEVRSAHENIKNAVKTLKDELRLRSNTEATSTPTN